MTSRTKNPHSQSLRWSLLGSATFLLAACLGSVEESEPISSHAAEIVNGTTSNNSDADKAIVAINGGMCSGTFIHPHYILSAAHCAPNCAPGATGCAKASDPDNVWSGDRWEGVAGPVANYRATDGVAAGSGAVYTIDYVHFPERRHFNSKEYPPDVALFRTVEPFAGLTIPVMAAETLPHPRTHCDLHDDEVVAIAGFSSNAGTESRSRRLGRAVVECDMERGDRAYKVDSRGFGSRTCGGDSGGPVVWTDVYGRRQVGGVHSFGPTNCPDVPEESGEAFVPRPFLEEHARTACPWNGTGSWDQCVNDSVGKASLGCFRDASYRDLAKHSFSRADMTAKVCISECRRKGYSFAATQYTDQCFCDNDYGQYGRATNCDMACAGNSAQSCGGRWANNVYRVAHYKGCYRDSSSRDLSARRFTDSRMSADMCIGKCRDLDYAYAAVQHGTECYCDNSYGRLGASNSCDQRCPGNASQTCGGAWANSVWSTR